MYNIDLHVGIARVSQSDQRLDFTTKVASSSHRAHCRFRQHQTPVCIRSLGHIATFWFPVKTKKINNIKKHKQ